VLTATRSPYVLVIGAAGFTFPRDAAALPFVKQVDAVDVDPGKEPDFGRQALPQKLLLRDHPHDAGTGRIYTDDRNTADRDHIDMICPRRRCKLLK
jgi:hypothetical protein